MGKGNLKNNTNQQRRTEMLKEKNDVIIMCNTILKIL